MKIGITLTQETIEQYQQLNKQNAFRFITFKITQDETVQIDQIGDTSKSSNELSSALPEKEGRYALVYRDFQDETSVPKRKYSKLFFIKWIPHGISVEEKMKYSLGTYSVKSHFVGVYKELQISDYNEIE